MDIEDRWSGCGREELGAHLRARERDATIELSTGDGIAGSVRLWVETGSYGAAPFEVMLAPGGEVVLGSAEDAGVRIEDVTVSARHCRVIHAGAFVEVADLGARNGV